MARIPILTLRKCFREFVREEQTISTRFGLEDSTSIHSTDMALFAQEKNTRVGRDVKCYSCQEFGHIAKNCKKKIGNYCKKEGHVITECRYYL